MNLLRYRLYRLICRKKLLGLGLLLALLCVPISRACTLAEFSTAARAAAEALSGQEAVQALIRAANRLCCAAYGFFIPGVLCAALAWPDFSEAETGRVLAAGYTPRQAFRSEIFLTFLTLFALDAVFLLLTLLTGWKDFYVVIEFVGFARLAGTLLLHELFLLGNACVFLLLTLRLPRREPLLLFGLFPTVLDTLHIEAGALFLRLFPTAGLPSALFGQGRAWMGYVLESCALCALLFALPERSLRK